MAKTYAHSAGTAALRRRQYALGQLAGALVARTSAPAGTMPQHGQLVRLVAAALYNGVRPRTWYSVPVNGSAAVPPMRLYVRIGAASIRWYTRFV